MATLEEQMKAVQEKLQLLVKRNQQLSKDNERLRGELSAARGTHQEHRLRIDELEQRISLSKMTNTSMDKNDKREMEKRLNQYIKEIDRCIAMLDE